MILNNQLSAGMSDSPVIDAYGGSDSHLAGMTPVREFLSDAHFLDFIVSAHKFMYSYCACVLRRSFMRVIRIRGESFMPITNHNDIE